MRWFPDYQKLIKQKSGEANSVYRRKISIIGAGNVGATIAYTLTINGMASEIVLVDVNHERAKGEAMDILHGTPCSHEVNIYSGDFSAIAGSSIVVLAAGVGRKPGQTRIDLAQTNVNIMKGIIPEVVKYAADAVIVVVSNPVDIITYQVVKTSGLPENQIIGSGTILDTARLRSQLAERAGVHSKNVHAHVLGEHGDTSIIPWSLATIAGMPFQQYMEKYIDPDKKLTQEELDGILTDMRTAGARVIAAKGATFYAIAMAVNRLCDSILRDTNTIMTVSTMLHGQCGVEGVCVSLPTAVGIKGAARTLEIPFSLREKEGFIASANAMKEIIKSLSI